MFAATLQIADYSRYPQERTVEHQTRVTQPEVAYLQTESRPFGVVLAQNGNTTTTHTVLAQDNGEMLLSNLRTIPD